MFLSRFEPFFVVFGAFQTVSDRFGLFWDGFFRLSFWAVSDRFDPFRTVSNRLGPFSERFVAFRTVSGAFRIVSDPFGVFISVQHFGSFLTVSTLSDRFFAFRTVPDHF